MALVKRRFVAHAGYPSRISAAARRISAKDRATPGEIKVLFVHRAALPFGFPGQFRGNAVSAEAIAGNVYIKIIAGFAETDPTVDDCLPPACGGCAHEAGLKGDSSPIR
jgi:hypothetical protein